MTLTDEQKALIEPWLLSRRLTPYIARMSGLPEDAIERWRDERWRLRKTARHKAKNARRKLERAARPLTEREARTMPAAYRETETLATPVAWLDLPPARLRIRAEAEGITLRPRPAIGWVA